MEISFAENRSCKNIPVKELVFAKTRRYCKRHSRHGMYVVKDKDITDNIPARNEHVSSETQRVSQGG